MADEQRTVQQQKTCAFFVKRKNRFCKMHVAKGKKYCGEHILAAGEVGLKELFYFPLIFLFEKNYKFSFYFFNFCSISVVSFLNVRPSQKSERKRIPCPLDPNQ